MSVFRVLQDIGDVRCAALHRHTTVQTAAARCEWMGDEDFLCLLRKAVRCDQVVHVVALAEHIRLVGATEARDRLKQRVENCHEVDGGAADDLEHVCGGGLLLQRLFEISRLGLYLVEQANILDGYHSLVGESGNQGYLLFSKKL